MSTTIHVDISEVVKEHFAKTGVLPPFVYSMAADRLEELIDAISSEEAELLLVLSTFLKSAKMRDGCFS